MGLIKRLVFPALVGLAVYYALFGGAYSVFDVRWARAERAVAAAQLQELRAEIEGLSTRAEALDTDPAALEQIAREKFGMIRDGELLYRMVPEAASEGGDDPPGG